MLIELISLGVVLSNLYKQFAKSMATDKYELNKAEKFNKLLLKKRPAIIAGLFFLIPLNDIRKYT